MFQNAVKAAIFTLFRNLREINKAIPMEKNPRKENKKSTPVENKKEDVKYHVNQSTEEKSGGSMGWVAVLVLIAIIVLGFLFFSPLWV